MNKEEAVELASRVTVRTALDQSKEVIAALTAGLKTKWKFAVDTGLMSATEGFIAECGQADSVWHAYAVKANEVLGAEIMTPDSFMKIVEAMFPYKQLTEALREARIETRSDPGARRF